MLKLRPYVHETDHAVISRWVNDERINALWSANHVPFPPEKDSFAAFLADIKVRNGDMPYAAVDEDDVPVGFFCYSLNGETHEGMLKFVIVDSEKRSHGYGKEMLALAVKQAFEDKSCVRVHLNVFPENPRAVRCYKGAGFKERDLTENAFKFRNESWGRLNMVFERP